MRILVICKALDRPESFMLKGLHERGVTVYVLTTQSNVHSQMLSQAGVAVSPFPFSSRLSLGAISSVRNFVREHSIDVVYALSNAGLSASCLGLRRAKTPIVTYRGTVGHLSCWDPTSWLTFLNPRISRIVCVSQAVERYLVELGIPQKKVVTVYKGHDVAWYTDPPGSTRADLGIPSDAYVVGCTALIRAVKGVDVLIRACEQLLPRLPKLHLLLIGFIKDPKIRQMVAAFPDSSRLHLTGYRPDATSLATLCDVTVMASKSREGFPKAVVEGMAQGVPAIVTAVGGMPELVGNGEAGLLVPPSNVDALAAAIERLASQPDHRRALAEAGRRRIVEVFNIDSTTQRMQALFHSLASGQP